MPTCELVVGSSRACDLVAGTGSSTAQGMGEGFPEHGPNAGLVTAYHRRHRRRRRHRTLDSSPNPISFCVGQPAGRCSRAAEEHHAMNLRSGRVAGRGGRDGVFEGSPDAARQGRHPRTGPRDCRGTGRRAGSKPNRPNSEHLRIASWSCKPAGRPSDGAPRQLRRRASARPPQRLASVRTQLFSI